MLIVGEPGLGKSRLIEEFHARLRETPHTWVEWSCSQLLQNTPLHPIAEWGRQRFGGADMPAEQRLADLEKLAGAGQARSGGERAPARAAARHSVAQGARIDIGARGVAPPATGGPDQLGHGQREDRSRWCWRSRICTGPIRPRLTCCAALPSAARKRRCFIVATTRPEFRPPWGMRSHHGTISLAPLDRGQVRDMVAELSARHALSRDVVDDVAARTGGVPLFVEEVTRLLLERGEQGGAQAIPPTLQQSLMARLDRLGSAREVAQIGSVIGRGFSYKLLKAVAGMDDAPLETALEKLSDADIVLVEGVLLESDYRFKHALIQDAAYENLLKSRRQVLHRRIAETLRDRFAAKAAAEPEVLAHHFTQAGLTDAAIEWWGKAGDQALRRSAFQEAIAHLGKAIEMADKTGESTSPAAVAPALASRRLKLQTSYGRALIWGKGYSAPETIAAYARARDLGANAGEATAKFETYYGQWAGGFMRGDFASCRDIAVAFVHDAEGAARCPKSPLLIAFSG